MTIPFQDIREARRLRSDEAGLAADLLAGDPEGAGGAFLRAEAWLELLADTGKIAYVAAPVASAPLGVVAVEPVPGEEGAFRVPVLWIAPGHRRKKWGSRLAERAVVWARRRGARSVLFAVPAGSEAAEEFARALRWRLTPEGAVADLRR